jgi:hypothetical protein
VIGASRAPFLAGLEIHVRAAESATHAVRQRSARHEYPEIVAPPHQAGQRRGDGTACLFLDHSERLDDPNETPGLAWRSRSATVPDTSRADCPFHAGAEAIRTIRPGLKAPALRALVEHRCSSTRSSGHNRWSGSAASAVEGSTTHPQAGPDRAPTREGGPGGPSELSRKHWEWQRRSPGSCCALRFAPRLLASRPSGRRRRLGFRRAVGEVCAARRAAGSRGPHSPRSGSRATRSLHALNTSAAQRRVEQIAVHVDQAPVLADLGLRLCVLRRWSGQPLRRPVRVSGLHRGMQQRAARP